MFTYTSDSWINSAENISIRKNRANRSEKPHVHEFAEFVYICSGRGTHWVSGAPYGVKRGSLLFINYGQSHSFETKEEMDYVNILLKPEFISQELINSESIYDIFSMILLDECRDGLENIRPAVLFEGDELWEIENVVEKMLSEFSQKDTGYKSVLNGYVRVLFSKMIRKMKSPGNPRERDYIEGVMPRVMAYINAHCLGKITLSEIAQNCFYNPSYLSKTFKKYRGQSLVAYIQERRIAESVNLLKNTEMTVESICAAVGYLDKKQFYKLFKEHMGLTPSEFRKKHR